MFIPFISLQGKILTSVEVQKKQIIFKGDDFRYIWKHIQSCCEHVYIEDIVGDLSDLIGAPILRAEEKYQRGTNNDDNTYTWAFYTLATIKGYVDFRWNGESNGCYSEIAELYSSQRGGEIDEPGYN